MNNNRHLTQDQRCIIQLRLEQGKSFKAIGRELEKDCTTISKEVKGHLVYERTGGYGNAFNNCANRKGCHVYNICPTCHKTSNRLRCWSCGKCLKHCPDYVREECPKLLRPPYVCNSCTDRSRCCLEKSMYRASAAQKEYETTLSESRSGFNLTENELAELDALVSPLIKNGHSIHHICSSNPGLISFCEKSIYNYASAGLLSAKNIDMPRRVRFRIRRKKSRVFKVDKKCRIHRTYEDFKAFSAEHPEFPITELDTVEGIKGGACLLTVHCALPKLQLAFKREHNNSVSVTEAIDLIYDSIGRDDFCRIFPILLCDNGSEFSDPLALEFDRDGNRRCHVFFCHASSPYEKGACENNHEFIRRIIPKGKDISYSSDQIRLMMSHINSYGRPELSDRSPYEMFSFLYGRTVIEKLPVEEIDRNKIILKPSLLNG